MTLNREDEKEDGNRYYDHILFPNITTADVNCDGYEEIVVAGYYNEVKEEKTYGFLANSDTMLRIWDMPCITAKTMRSQMFRRSR